MKNVNMDLVKCAICAKQKPVMKRCSRCQRIYYCSRECQMQDWPSHKEVCCVAEKKISSVSHGKDIWDASEISSDPGADDSKTIYINIKKSVPQSIPAVKGCRNTEQFKEHDTEVHHSEPKQLDNEDRPAESPKKSSNDPETSKAIYLHRNMIMTDVPVLDPHQPSVTIVVKANKQKQDIALQTSWSPCEMLKAISHRLRIPLDKVKLIHKGKLVKREDLSALIKNKAVFQAIGEQAEDEGGLEVKDIEVLMKQLSIDRNEAIKALRKDGDVLDAILSLSNK